MIKFLQNTIILLTILAFTVTVSPAANFWTPGTNPAGSSTITCMTIASGGSILVGTSGNGLYRTTDNGTTWNRIDKSPTNGYFYSVAVDKNNTIWAGSYTGFFYTSSDNGASWTVDTAGASIVSLFLFTESGKILIGTEGDGVFTTNDNRKTWVSVTAGYTNPRITSGMIDSYGTIFIGTFGGGIFTSSDDGTTWTPEGQPFWRVNAMVSGTKHTLFAGTDEGIYLDSLTYDTLAPAPNLTIDSVRGVWTPSGFYLDHTYKQITTDTTYHDTLGHVDTLYHYDTTTVPVYYHERRFSMALAASATGHIFAGTVGHGVFESTDNGNSWKIMTTGIDDSTITTMGIDAAGYLYATTSKGGFFKSTNPEPIVSPSVQSGEPRLVPVTAKLEQNYPNPFNPTTTIPFTLTTNSYTTLVVYDILGKEVVRLVDGVVSAGRHEVKWDASSIPSGVYFYRFQTSGATKTGKLTLLK